MASLLLGPPELRDYISLQQKPITASGLSDPFMDLTVSNFNNSTSVNNIPYPQMSHTENESSTYLSTGNPCLDIFFHVLPSTPKESIEKRLQVAWEHDPLTTLKLICNLRGVRGTGKSDKEGFYTAALWLHAFHPKTLACNLDSLSKFGYFKDIPELLYRILQGFEIRSVQKSKLFHKASRNRGKTPYSGCGPLTATRELRVAKAERRNQEEKAKASLDRKKKKFSLGKEAFIRYSHDSNYRFLHERVSDLFADYLKKDVTFLTSGETKKISLAAKWCPSLDSSFYKATLLCETIARKIFPRASFPEYEGVEEAHYAYRVCDRLSKQILVPLRKTLQLPEVYMGAKNWETLPYKRVASMAMNLYKMIFLEHDEERFVKYLEDGNSEKTSVVAGALLLQEIINGLDGGQVVAELQWKRMVDDLKRKGSLTNCIAISDVSGSMEGTPREVAIALGLLVSELSQEPWRGNFITFSKIPTLHFVEGDDLRSKRECVRR